MDSPYISTPDGRKDIKEIFSEYRKEPIDENWKVNTEQSIKDFLNINNQQWPIQVDLVSCKSTVCELRLNIPLGNRSVIYDAMLKMYNEPWYVFKYLSSRDSESETTLYSIVVLQR